MTVLADGQIELRAGDADALVIGPATSYRFAPDWLNWWAAPAVRTTDTPRTGANGVTAGRDLYGTHTTNLVVQLIADSASDLGDLIDAWKAATAMTPDSTVTVRANLLGRTRRRVGRFRIPGEIIPRGKVTTGGHVANASCQFVAFDGRTYGDTLNEASTQPVLPGTGFEAPVDVPFTLGDSTLGVCTITNSGNIAAPWTARLDGPLTGITVSHVESGRRLDLSFTANGELTLATGEYVTLDSDARSVLLNGTADRRTVLTVDSQWWDLEPGDNSFELTADTGTGTLTVSAYDAYHS